MAVPTGRPPGRPRIHPLPDPTVPKRGRGRPRKVIAPPGEAVDGSPVLSASADATTVETASAASSVSLPADLLAMLSDPALKAALKFEAKKQLSYRRLDQFRPYPKQEEFYSATATDAIVLMLAANRTGKSFSAAAMTAMHLTGRYPDWYTGRRFDEPIRTWACGLTAEVTRDVQQFELIGPPGRESEWGTGLIPREALGEHTMLRGVASAIDTISIRHVSGGWSTLSFKAFSQGRERFQGTAQHLVWLDEEAPLDVFSECVVRTSTLNGLTVLTFTPLNGYSELVSLFLGPKPPGAVIRATLDDALHFTPEQRERMIAAMLPHEREARSRGEPALGSGAIFPYTEEQITCAPFAIPSHWPVIGAIDFGFAHETAAVKLAWDREADVVYVSHIHKAKELTPVMHAATLKGWGKNMPFAYPHDGDNRERGSGDTVAEMYRKNGLNFLPSPVKFEDGGNSVEAGIEMLRERFLTDRLKIFSHLGDLLTELRRYHRKDGRIRKTDDHLLDALRYAMMGLRFAETATHWDGGAIRRNYRRLV